MTLAKILIVILFVLLAVLSLLGGMRAAESPNLSSGWAAFCGVVACLAFAVCALSVASLA